MQRNVGGRDRTVRIVLGVLLVVVSMATVAFGSSLGFQTQLLVSAALLIVGATSLATAGARTCPINSALGRDTHHRESRL